MAGLSGVVSSHNAGSAVELSDLGHLCDPITGHITHCIFDWIEREAFFKLIVVEITSFDCICSIWDSIYAKKICAPVVKVHVIQICLHWA